MLDASTDRTATQVEPAEHLGAGIVMLWLVMGSAMIATAIVAFGWVRTIEIWFGSGVLLGLICVAERVWHRHHPPVVAAE